VLNDLGGIGGNCCDFVFGNGTSGGLVGCVEATDRADGVVSQAWLLQEEACFDLYEYHDLSDVLQRGMETRGR